VKGTDSHNIARRILKSEDVRNRELWKSGSRDASWSTTGNKDSCLHCVEPIILLLGYLSRLILKGCCSTGLPATQAKRIATVSTRVVHRILV
jgi:hypothetical protein